jgi:hypothetical protein
LNYPITISFLVPGCNNVALVGNGFCSDETNNPNCNYDGGDCCAVNPNTSSCSECVCHFLETCAAGYHPLVGNGFCNDVTNIAECDYDGGDCCGSCVFTKHCEDCACLGSITSGEITNPLVGNNLCNDETNNINCNYDGGDCCGYNINSEHCTECTCFHQETCLAGVTHVFVADGVCNDKTNNAECEYDGGDCCLMNVNTDSCSDCNCLGSGVITSPGFPVNYDDNLDLSWLIQVQIGQLIDISFIDFELYSW